MFLKRRIVPIVLVILLLGLVGIIAPASVSAASTRQAASHTTPAASTFTGIPVSGTVTRAGQTLATFTGTLNVTRFVVQNGHLLALGNVSGTLTNTITGQTTHVSNVPVAMPVAVPAAATRAAVPAATCQILNLVLGPLHLNLLGLVVDLNQVVLNITAQQAPGSLLGNLLCAIANLLNTGGSLNSLANLLNQVLSIVG